MFISHFWLNHKTSAFLVSEADPNPKYPPLYKEGEHVNTKNKSYFDNISF